MDRFQISCCYRILLCAIFLVLFSGVNGQASKVFRLPADTVPIGYDVELTVNLERSKFFGTVRISLKANNDSSFVVLNIKELHVGNVTLTEDGGSKARPTKTFIHPESEMGYFNFDPELRSAHTYELSIDFTGSITDDLKGLYKSSYYRGTEERFVATTFNAAANARTIFPCYDEPHLKATFKLRIFHKPEFRALSNMPVNNRIESANSDNMTVTEFTQSPPMSSYLLAFVVSDFGEIRLDSKFAAHAQLSVIDSTRYALNFTKDAIQYLEIFFQRPYQLDKLDIVAVDDFLMGAMENWGLITYKTSRIVYREGLEKTEKLQAITKVVFHELIHQWYGNEATSAWWSYIWLNEGFTTFLESYILDKIHPEWRLMDQFLVNDMHVVMEMDVLPNARPMTKPIVYPDQIAGIYDFVVYPKAASVIRMWQSIIGHAVFDEFLLAYLADRSYKAATEEDMIRVLQNTVDKHGLKLPPMNQIVQSWTTNPSFPLLAVNRLDDGSVTVTAHPSQTFYIPLNWISKTNKSGSEWITDLEGKKSITLKGVTPTEWVIFNPNQYGYFRVNYDHKSWNLLIEALKQDHRQIPTLSRAQLIDDALSLAKDNKLNIEILLAMLEYIPKEVDLIPLKAAYKAFRYLDRMLQGTDFYSTYQQYQYKILGRVYDQMLENSNDDHLSRLYRVKTREVACELGVLRCLKDALNLFEGFVTIDPDLRASVMCGALKASEHYDVWALMLKRMVYLLRNFEQKRINVEEFEDILYGFSCVVSRERLSNYLLLSLSFTETLENADRIKMFNYIANSGVNGTNLAIQWLNSQLRTLTRRYGSLTEIITNMKNVINTPGELNEFEYFMENNTDVNLGFLIYDVYSDAQKNVQWAKEKSYLAFKWISAHSLAFSLSVSRILTVVGFLVAVYPFY